MTVEIFDKIVEQQEEICRLKRELEKTKEENKMLHTECKVSIKKDEIAKWFDVYNDTIFVKDEKKEELLKLIKNIGKELIK